MRGVFQWCGPGTVELVPWGQQSEASKPSGLLSVGFDHLGQTLLMVLGVLSTATLRNWGGGGRKR